MYTWLFKKIGWKFFAVGAATAFVGAKFVRPAMVTLVKTGMDVTDVAAGTWNEAKVQTSKIVSEAADLRNNPESGLGGTVSAELNKLRAELAAVKASGARTGASRKTATKRVVAKKVAAKKTATKRTPVKAAA
jgi:hypothetical protein